MCLVPTPKCHVWWIFLVREQTTFSFSVFVLYIFICCCCCLVREMVCCVLCMEKPFSNWNENFLCAYVQFWNATLVFHFGYDIWNGVVIHTSLSFYRQNVVDTKYLLSYFNQPPLVYWLTPPLAQTTILSIIFFFLPFSFLLASAIHLRRYHSDEHLLHETNKNSH